MNFRRVTTGLLAIFALAFVAPVAIAQGVRPPVAKVSSRTDTLHGEILVDPYHWLRDRNNPETISYLEAENRYTEAQLAHTQGLQEQLYKEMVSHIKETDLSVPELIDGYYYYSRTEQGKQYSIYCRKKGSLTAPEEVLLDENVLAQGHSYFRIGLRRVSPNQKLLAYNVDTSGAESFVMMVKDLATGNVLEDRVPNTTYGIEWANDNRTLFYTTFDSAKRPYRLYRHALGTPASADSMLLQEDDVLFSIDLYKTKSNAYLIAHLGSYTSDEVHFLDANRPRSAWKLVQRRQADLEYSVEHHGNNFIILTNDDGATNFKIVNARVDAPTRAFWTPVIEHRDSVKIDGMDVFRSHLVLYERKGGLQTIEVMNFNGGERHFLTFPDPVYATRRSGNPEYDTRVVRFSYTSLVASPSVYDYDMTTRQRTLLKQQEVPGGYDPSRYASERVWARAKDGVMVPVSLVYRKPLARDGKRPMLLYAYGSYGSSTDPAFSSNRISLLDRGVIFAIAHIRGGQEMGRAWYDQGKMLNKKNTFTDFIAAAEHLVAAGYTSREKLAIQGGSAGGLLMGAVTNMRPDLFKAVVADVPFVDVINTMLDASIPLTAQEWMQWGNPRIREQYVYMKSYSPYDNVQRKAYPHLLVTAGLNDPRVGYWEPAKWVAKLRAMKTDNNTLLLRTNMGAGHGGASGRYDYLKEVALRYAFILDKIGAVEPVPVSN
jgi:oligopeptidase B